MADKFQLKAIISAVDKLTPTLKGIAKQGKIVRKSLGDITAGTGKLIKSLGVGSAVVAGGIFGMMKSVIDETAKFESLGAVLESIEGSAEAARKAINWVDEFANNTPYDLDESVRAFTTLRGAGLDPTTGSLEAVGNAAAGANRSLGDAADAFRSALFGNTMALRGFNIQTRKSGDELAFMWRKNGKDMVSIAKATNREMIAATLTGIFNEKYPDAAEKQSKTWIGLMAMYRDYYTRFLRFVGQAGIFDNIKNQLLDLKDVIEKWIASGQFEALSKQISDDLIAVVSELAAWVRNFDWESFYKGIKTTIKSVRELLQAIGGLKTVMIALGVVLLAGPVHALGQIAFGIYKLIPALFMLGKAFMVMLVANPILLAIAAVIALIAGAVYLVYKNWEPLKDFMEQVWIRARDQAVLFWGFLKEFFGWSPIGLILRSWGPVLRFFGGLWDTVKNIVGSVPGVQGALDNSGAPGLESPRRNFAGLDSRTQVNGEMTVRFENAPPGMRAESGKTNQPGLDLNPDVGYRPLAVFGM